MKSDFINCKNCTDDCHCKGKDITPICISFKPAKTTNADRIRAMTDEELATFLVQTMTCTACRDMHGGECPKPKDYKEKKCSDMILEWLKEEAVFDG